MFKVVLKAMRPHQWVKNFFVFAPAVFAQHILEPDVLLRTVLGFFVFSLLAGSVYLLNDLIDQEADRAHPVKKNRPIASGALPEASARSALAAAALLAVALGWWLSPSFLAAALTYLAVNLAYSFAFKKVAYLDVACIASGFLLRVLAGSFVVVPSIELSHYLLVTTFCLSFYLGLGKRLGELAGVGTESRKALKGYRPAPLRITMVLFGLASGGCYLAYTLDHRTEVAFGSQLLWVTSVPVILGLARFYQILQRSGAHSPTDLMLKDIPFLLNLAVWAGLVATIMVWR